MTCMQLTKKEAEAIWKEAEAQREHRAQLMPSVEAALILLTQAHHRLKELGWREAMYCPKDGSLFEVIEAGSSGIHTCHYHGEWPNGWWVSDGGDLWPSHPILWRPIPPKAAKEGQHRTPASKLIGVEIDPPCSCPCNGDVDPFCWHHGVVNRRADNGPAAHE